MRTHLLVFFLLGTCFCYSQSNVSFNGSVEASGYVSTNDSLPLWMYTNTSGKVGRVSAIAGLLEGEAIYSLTENSEILAGGAFYYRDNVADEFQRKNLYLQFRNSWLDITAGAKEFPEVAQGLSAINKNYLWTRNARPLPGIRIASAAPLKISRTFSVDAGIAHYELNDDRITRNTRLHYKHFALITNFNENHSFTAKIQHFAQWAGTSPDFGTLKNDFSAFVDVFTARESPEIGVDGEIYNAVGNHLGTYLFDYKFSTSFASTSIYHEHPFEDGSGTGFSNFPDGVWGIYVQPKKNTFISGIVYEFITTKDQSGATGGSGFDNYFNNSVYRSGWTYEGAMIGLPFMITAPRGELNEDRVTFISNSLSMHHVAVAGVYNKFAWKVKSSFVKNFGRLVSPFAETLTTTHHSLEITYPTQKLGTFTLLTGFDSSSSSDAIFGAGVQYAYRF
ncbi:capsule assembly Wzi family protein [Rasiella rasia]|uniref:Capsule assembly Wzi family protein n=1 Tax=Rasiella rasia TaxID=2744027 RepID=A0A6G6GID0_9FLAO|nr:capsule assembly Wzi family protein [Rasiella rasia]QIE58277.1 capsule assembly Wzi family protein [Rasiella rasia]